jgi:hypothetical protein
MVQTDMGWYFIWTLEKIGLAHAVKRPKLNNGLVPMSGSR